MISQNITWYFPEKISEAYKLIKKDGVILHAGGTRILKTNQPNLKGLVDIGNLKLNKIEKHDNKLSIGSAVTFAEVVDYCNEHNILPGLKQSLSEAASTPLRNRITIGGSLKDFPLWSSLYAPLIALDAKIEIVTLKSKVVPVEDYIKKNVIRSKHIIKSIILPIDNEVKCLTKRFNLIRFEYPLFNISASVKMKEGVVEDSRIVITGVKGRYHRFKLAEKVLAGKPLSEQNIEKSAHHFIPKFHSDFRYSAEYKEHTAKVFFTDMMNNLRRELL
jgi:CO/xanthine dehydrogenase FAD-binding subunit